MPRFTREQVTRELTATPRRRHRGKLGYKGKKTTKNFRKKVKGIIFGLAEKKIANKNSNFSFQAYTGSASDLAIIPISPYTGFIEIAQGTGCASRIGNEIRTASARLSGVIYPLPYDATTYPNPEPMEVRMWFFSVKSSVTRPTTLPDFFENGATANAPSGTLSDMIKHINQELYTYRGHRTWKLGTAGFAGSGAQTAYQNFANNDFKYNCKFSIDITKMLAKTYKYNDTTNTPQASTFFFIEAVRASGGSITSSWLTAQLVYEIEYNYTDI